MKNYKKFWENWSLEQVVGLLKGNDHLLMRVLEELGIGVATTYDVVRQEELLCNPIIWKEEDLESVTLEQWNGTRAYKTLSERSIEGGHEIKQALVLMCKD